MRTCVRCLQFSQVVSHAKPYGWHKLPGNVQCQLGAQTSQQHLLKLSSGITSTPQPNHLFLPGLQLCLHQPQAQELPEQDATVDSVDSQVMFKWNSWLWCQECYTSPALPAWGPGSGLMRWDGSPGRSTARWTSRRGRCRTRPGALRQLILRGNPVGLVLVIRLCIDSIIFSFNLNICWETSQCYTVTTITGYCVIQSFRIKSDPVTGYRVIIL